MRFKILLFKRKLSPELQKIKDNAYNEKAKELIRLQGMKEAEKDFKIKEEKKKDGSWWNVFCSD